MPADLDGASSVCLSTSSVGTASEPNQELSLGTTVLSSVKRTKISFSSEARLRA